jgi:hypothetical protein
MDPGNGSSLLISLSMPLCMFDVLFLYLHCVGDAPPASMGPTIFLGVMHPPPLAGAHAS